MCQWITPNSASFDGEHLRCGGIETGRKNMVFAFGAFELDLATCELRCGGRSIPLQPRVFATLRYLVEHRDRVIGKQELIDALWGGHQLNAIAVPWTINRVRNALRQDEQNDDEQRFIETVRGHGYRFIAEVLATEVPRPADSALTTAPSGQAPHEHWQRRMNEPFVGREQVMQQLTAALDHAALGGGTLLLLSGEAGIGKTRCASEFAVLTRRRGLQVWIGRCLDNGIAPAFWPFIQILRAARADLSLDDVGRKEAESLLGELEPSAARESPGVHSRPQGDARFWLLDRLSRWLCRVSKSQTRVVEIDDMQWADESSLQALSLVAPLLAQSRMLLVVTVRDNASMPTEQRIAGLATRFRPCERVELSGLSVEEVGVYLSAWLDSQSVAQLRQALHARTAGNPLLVREVARVVQAQYARSGSVRAEDVQLPEAAKEILSGRFATLDTQTRAVLDTACVMGEEFEPSVLQRATGVNIKALSASLEAAVAHNIVNPKSDATYAFVHPLLRELLYAALPTAKRAQLHAATALAFESVALIDPKLNELAYHFHHAPAENYSERASRYGRLAGNAAMRVVAYDEAAKFYAWALDAQPYLVPPDVRAACDVLLLSAESLFLAGRRRESRAHCQRAIELARQATLPDVIVQATRIMRPSVWFAQIPDPEVVSALEDALRLAPATAVATRARAYSQLASLPPYTSRIESSREMSDEAVRLASSVDDPMLLLEALCSRFYALSGPDSTDELLRVVDATLKLDEERASLWSADAQLARYHALVCRGETLAATAALEALRQIAGVLRLSALMWHYDRLRIQRVLHAGRLDEAEQEYQVLWHESQRLRLPQRAFHFRAQVFALNLERTGKRLSPDIESAPVAWQWAQSIPVYRTHRMLFAIEIGDLPQARREFRSLSELQFSVVPKDSTYLFALCQLSVAAVALAEHDAAIELRALLLPYANHIALNGVLLSMGCVSRYLGMLERYLDRQPQARRHYEVAIEVDARTGHELERLRACLGLADLLLESPNRKDQARARARALLTEVQTLANDCGAEPLRAAAANLLARSVALEPSATALPMRKPARSATRPAKAIKRKAAR